MKTSVPPITSPSRVSGRITRANTCAQLAPSTRAAGMASFGMFSIAETSEITISGRNSCNSPMNTAVSENRMRSGLSRIPSPTSAWFTKPVRPRITSQA